MLLNYSDKSFDLSRSKLYSLSIQISLNGFSFCIYDSELNKHVSLKRLSYSKSITNITDLVLAIAAILDDEPVFKNEFQNIQFIYVSSQYLLIPGQLVDKNAPLLDQFQQQLSVCFEMAPHDEVRYTYFEQLQAYCTYVLPNLIVSEITSRYPQAELSIQVIDYLKHCLQAMHPFAIQFSDRFINVCIYKDQQIQLLNAYPINSMTDAIYYINALRLQYQLDPQQIYLEGDLKTQDIELFTQYLSQPTLGLDGRIALLVGTEAAYYFHPLLKIQTCAL